MLSTERWTNLLKFLSRIAKLMRLFWSKVIMNRRGYYHISNLKRRMAFAFRRGIIFANIIPRRKVKAIFYVFPTASIGSCLDWRVSNYPKPSTNNFRQDFDLEISRLTTIFVLSGFEAGDFDRNLPCRLRTKEHYLPRSFSHWPYDRRTERKPIDYVPDFLSPRWIIDSKW